MACVDNMEEAVRFFPTSITVIHTRLSSMGIMRLPRPQGRETNAQFIINKWSSSSLIQRECEY